MSIQSEPQVGIVISQREWSRRLPQHCQDHGGLNVRARIIQEAQVLDTDYEVLVVDDRTSFLTARLVDRVHKAGRKVVGVFDPADGDAGHRRLEELRVDATVSGEADPDKFVRVIQSLTAHEAASSKAYLETDPDFEELRTEIAQRDGPISDDPFVEEELPLVHAPVVVVAGPAGGGGITEVTIAMAAALRRRGHSTVVIDCDDSNPALSQRLDLNLLPNIRTAADDFSQGRSHGDPERLAQLCEEGGFYVVAGLASPKDWSELDSLDVVWLVDALTRIGHSVVVNGGANIEDLSYLGPRAFRYGLTRAMLARADVVVAVCAESPTGLARLVEWWADAKPLANGTPRHVAVNKSTGGQYRRAEFEGEVARTVAPSSVTFLPEDPKVREAEWKGVLVSRGAFTKAVARLLESVAPAAPKRRFRRKKKAAS